jgi:hypothetical protein
VKKNDSIICTKITYKGIEEVVIRGRAGPSSFNSENILRDISLANMM